MPGKTLNWEVRANKEDYSLKEMKLQKKTMNLDLKNFKWCVFEEGNDFVLRPIMRTKWR